MQGGRKKKTVKNSGKCHTGKPLILNVTLSELLLNISRNFYDTFTEHIVQQSNLFATQKNPNKGLALSRGELDLFLGAVTFMSFCRLPRSRLYWAAESRAHRVADTMSRDW